jgi:hypothetical protein
VQRRFVVMLIVTLFPVAAWTAGAWHAATSSPEHFTSTPAASIPAATTTGDSGWSSLPVPLLDEPDVDAERDLYGNDVSDAVAKYKSDATGSFYEEHSPNTQVPHLKPPTS